MVRFNYQHKLEYITINNHENSELLKSDIHLITAKDSNFYYSLKYLVDESFIEFKEDPDSGGVFYNNFRITSNGIKIIEGVNVEKYKNELEDKFHITINVNNTIESLIRNELGGINLSLLNLKDILG